MRVAREDVTPALAAAVRAFVGNGQWVFQRAPVETPSDRPPPVDRARQLIGAHRNRFAAEILTWFPALLFLGTGMLFAAGEASSARQYPNTAKELYPESLGPFSPISSFTKGWLVFAASTLVLAVVITLWKRAVRPDGPRPTVEFLAAALPRLDLNPPERVHAETLVRAYERGDDVLKTEALPALRSLCAEWARLDAIESDLASDGPHEGEVEALRAKLARIQDPGARAARRAPRDGRPVGARDRRVHVPRPERCARRRPRPRGPARERRPRRPRRRRAEGGRSGDALARVSRDQR